MTPRAVISLIPRVIRAASVLSPNPKPSIIPAAKAITFFSEPPSSIDFLSGLIYVNYLQMSPEFSVLYLSF